MHYYSSIIHHPSTRSNSNLRLSVLHSVSKYLSIITRLFIGEEVFGSVLQSKREIIRGTVMRQKVGRRVDDIRKPKIVHCVHAARARYCLCQWKR